MPPDIVTYNTCVTVAGQAGRLDEALELLRKASEEGGLQLDVVSAVPKLRLFQEGGRGRGKWMGRGRGRGRGGVHPLVVLLYVFYLYLFLLF